MFTSRHISRCPLPQSTLRIERAPFQRPEYRGCTPRAALHRLRRIQLANLAHYESAIPRPADPDTVIDATTLPPERSWPWSAATLVILALIVAAAVRVAV